jgi:archaellum component FlaF (FlaF/FlaG flagellin family)
MTINKTSRSIFGLAFTGVMVTSFAAIALLMIIVYELAQSGRAISNFTQTYLSFREALQNNTGNEFTGEATAWLFGVSSIPVGIDLISKTMIRYVPIEGTLINFIRRMNNLQKKYLMPLHTYLSIAALSLGILHLALSSCIANPFPELGLLLTGILVTTGLLFKWMAVPVNLRRTLYKFHSSLIVSGILLAALYTGHTVMGFD